MITLEESQYKGYVQSHPKDAEFLNKPIVNYMPMQIILAAALQLGNHLKLLLPLMLTPLKPLNEEGSSGGSKFSWPELVGKKGKEARAIILKENPCVTNVVYAPQDAVITDNYCCNRVRLLMNCDAGCDYKNAIVFDVPIVG